MQTLDTDHLIRSPHVRETHNEDGAVLLDPVGGKCYPLDPVSAFIWKHLGEGFAPIQVAEKVAATCNISVEIAKADVAEFVQSLVNAGLLSPQNCSQPPSVSRFRMFLNGIGFRGRNHRG
jgi:hypothetical protein